MEAARLVVEGRVSILYKGGGTAIFLVESKTKAYRVHLNPDGTVSCTSTHWTYWGEVCQHILASQFCHHAHEVVR
ncbi:MAG: hypothetical protein ACE5R6_08395 [Candidatus Heimdallarchaeota archaeon]